jgi:hypothetical protein
MIVQQDDPALLRRGLAEQRPQERRVGGRQMDVLVAKADVELERHSSGRREPDRRPDDMGHADGIVETASLRRTIEPAEGAGDLRRGWLG